MGYSSCPFLVTCHVTSASRAIIENVESGRLERLRLDDDDESLFRPAKPRGH